MTKITLTDLANLQNENTAVNAINSNNAVIKTAFDNTLSRDGTVPNTMQSYLDMNSNRILNLPFPSSGTEPARYGDINVLLTGLTSIPVPSDRWTIATGTGDAIVATYNPVVASLSEGLILGFRAPGANTLSNPTFAPNGLTAHPITRAGGLPLGTSEIKTNSEISVRYNLSNTRWEIVNTFVGASTTYSTATEIATTTVPSSITAFRTLGYGAAGDGGAALYKRVGAATSGGVTSLDGAFWQNVEKVLRPEMFSTTADTLAIQIAIDTAVITGVAGEVRLANKAYRAVTQGTYCLHLYGGVNLVGDAAGVKDGFTIGTGSIINWGSNVSNTTDIISWTGGASNARIQGIQFMPDGFTGTIGNISGLTLYGRNVINVNAGVNLVFSNSVISDCCIGPSNTGYSINFSNTSFDWATGLVIRNNIWGGIIAAALLDNSTFRDNSFNGIKAAMEITMASGAANLLIEHNNGITTGGAVILHNSAYPKIINNYFEMALPSTALNGYLYSLNGDIGTIFNCEFRGNICTQLGDFGLTGLVFVHNNNYLDFDDNFLTNSGATPIAGVVFSATNTKPYVGKLKNVGNTTPAAGVGVSRPGVTFINAAAVTPAGYDVPLILQNGWTPVGIYEVPSVRCGRDGTCEITGAIQGGTTGASTIIFNVPIGYRPVKQVFRLQAANNTTVAAQLGTDGNFSWFGSSASATITSVNMTYMTGTE